MLKKSLETDKYSCTFTETSCPRGEDPAVTVEALRHSITLAESFVNSSVVCYVNKDDPSGHTIFLEYNQYLSDLIVFSTLFSLFVLGITVLSLISYLQFERKWCFNKKDETDLEVNTNKKFGSGSGSDSDKSNKVVVYNSAFNE